MAEADDLIRTAAAGAVVFAVVVVPVLAGCVGGEPDGSIPGFRVDVRTSYSGHRAELNGTPATGGTLNVKVLDSAYYRNNPGFGSGEGTSRGGGGGAFSTQSHPLGGPIEAGVLLELAPGSTANTYHVRLDEDGAVHFFIQRDPLILVKMQVAGEVPGVNDCDELFYYWPDWVETDVGSDLNVTVPWKHTCRDERSHG